MFFLSFIFLVTDEYSTESEPEYMDESFEIDQKQ